MITHQNVLTVHSNEEATATLAQQAAKGFSLHQAVVLEWRINPTEMYAITTLLIFHKRTET